MFTLPTTPCALYVSAISRKFLNLWARVTVLRMSTYSKGTGFEPWVELDFLILFCHISFITA